MPRCAFSRIKMDLLIRCVRRSCLAIVLYSITCGTTGIAADVVLVQGTLSAPNAAERRYSHRLTGSMSRWLDELGVKHQVITDERLNEQALRNSRVAMLVYNPTLPSQERAVLREFVGRGGKLIVFYSADVELAELMDMKLGDYLLAQNSDEWTSFLLNEKAPPHARIRVSQTSRNIRSVIPIHGKSTVIGYWENASQTSTGHPAWLSSAKGFWMSHVLLDDGDSSDKKLLILALLGWCDPEIWKDAAKSAFASAGTLGKYSDLEATLRELKESGRAMHTQATENAISKARTHYANASEMIQRGDYADVIHACNEINNIVMRAYCRIRMPWPVAMLGAWNHSGMGLHGANWAKTCATLKSHGITDVFPNFLWPGSAHYDSNIQPASDVHRFYGDQPAQCVAAARATGLKVHAWKVCWRLDRAPKAFVERVRKEGRLQVTDTGRTIEWLCPSHPENRIYEKEAIRELVRKYDIDGIHLDYIRYPDAKSCFCRHCRKRFESSIARGVAQWPDDVHRGRLRSQYAAWRAEQITQLVRDVNALAKRLRPGIQVSAAVYGMYPQCIDSVGQDWGMWLREGYVDFVCPMNYTVDTDEFVKWTRRQMAITDMRDRIYPGIGCTASEGRLDAVKTVDQIAAAKRAGATGVMIFDLNPFLKTEILPFLMPPATADGK
jgi:uncharacterized lipoprotein YddW (UPF0748 family)